MSTQNKSTKPSKATIYPAEQRAWCEWWLERGAHMALLEFCSLEGGRYAIAEPFVVGECLYATDGRILVRQSGPVHEDIISEQSPEVKVPPVEELPWPEELPSESQPLPCAFPAFGDWRNNEDDEEEQTLTLSRPHIAVFGSCDVGIASHFAMRLRSLGATTIYRINTHHKTPFYVPIAEGVDALLMPCKMGGSQ
jgi:hypothetical protein